MGMLRYALDWRLRPDVPAGTQAFPYHRNIQPMLWALLFACLVELVAAHVLVGLFFGARAAWAVFALSLIGLVYVVGLMRSLSKLPLLVSPEGVRVRAGTLIDAWLPLDRIAGAACVINCGDTKRPGFLKAALMAYPNVVLDIAPPVAVRRANGRVVEVTAVGLHPDDGQAFIAAIARAKLVNSSPVVESGA